jgi:chemotaxis protein MotB
MLGTPTPPNELSFAVPESPAGGSGHLDLSDKEDMLFGNRMPKAMHWSIPWSDLMMTMFILFAIMYIYHSSTRDVLSTKKKDSTISVRKEPGTDITIGKHRDFTESLNESISNIYDMSKETVRANDLEDFASVALVPDKAVRIILTGDLLFDSGKADLKLEAKRSLERIADVIRRAPYMVNVVGHTDNVPIHSERFPTNWELSAIRACEVARCLIEEMGIPGKRFYISGHAYHQPVFPKDSPQNRAANRRVEIIITKERPYGRPGIGENVLGLGLLEGARRSRADTWPWNTFR